MNSSVWAAPGTKEKKVDLIFLATFEGVFFNFKFFFENIASSVLKVSRSRNMKQKIYEILTSPKIQTNGVILNNCID